MRRGLCGIGTQAVRSSAAPGPVDLAVGTIEVAVELTPLFFGHAARLALALVARARLPLTTEILVATPEIAGAFPRLLSLGLQAWG